MYNEFIVNDNESKPLLLEEYKQVLQSTNALDIGPFFVMQNQLEKLCFGEDASSKLCTLFDKLSGSAKMKEQSADLKRKVTGKEQELRSCNEKLKILRQEKIKIQGLTEF